MGAIAKNRTGVKSIMEPMQKWQVGGVDTKGDLFPKLVLSTLKW